MQIRCGNHQGTFYHDSIADVRACFEGANVATVAQQAQRPKPTAKQLSYIESLLSKNSLRYVPGMNSLDKFSASGVITALKDGSAHESDDFEPTSSGYVCLPCAGGDCGECIGRLPNDLVCQHSCSNPANSFANGTAHVEAGTFERMDIPGLGNVPVRKTPDFDTETLDDGFYALRDPNGENLPVVYKVIVAVHGSGRKYAKRLNTDTGEWGMARGAIRLLRPEHKMSLEDALKVAKAVATDVNGALYGRCFKCGRTLTAEDSIERFMGPVCAESFN